VPDWLEVDPPLRGLLEALLIGLLIGAERELYRDEEQAGFRDFVLIALAAAVCALLALPWLTVTALAGVTAMLGISRYRAERRTGITTELAAVTTFCLAYLAAAPEVEHGAVLAIGIAIVVSAFLAAKRWLHQLIRETITSEEFNDTLRFLALIFVIYPLLPADSYGPYEFFEPRRVWVFVILVCSISYVGYFFEKFLGPEKGIRITSVLGGVASTTAATLSFARGVAERPETLKLYWWATVVANAVQFPRVLLILWLVNSTLGQYLAAPLLAMAAVGGVIAAIISRLGGQDETPHQVPLRNPFSLRPALKFGVIFTLIMFLTRAVAAEVGGRGLLVSSLVAGFVDVDALTLSMASLQNQGSVEMAMAGLAVLLALTSNAVVKTILAFSAANRPFGIRVALAFMMMFGVGLAVWAVMYAA
jgi:uncharacterized membrane protein (DUF4010 family)